MQPGEHRYIELLKSCLTASLYAESAWAVVPTEQSRRDRRLLRPRRYLRTLARSALARWCRRRSWILLEHRDFDEELRREGRDWPLFGYTMVGRKRLDHLQHCVEDVLRRGVPGDFLEAGVWRGGASILMRALLEVHGVRDRCVWAADSFQGLPPPEPGEDAPDLSGDAFLAVSADEVRANFARFGLLDDQVRLLEGWFADTLPTAPVERLAVLRLDGDLYASTMDALRSLYPRVSAGGYVVVDDYGSWPSCRAAVHDYLDEHGLRVEIEPIDWTGAFWRVPEPAEALATSAG